MTLLILLSVVGLTVNRGVDLIRHFFDKADRIPKGYWLLLAWAFGVGMAVILCNAPDSVLRLVTLAKGKGCPDFVLSGIGYGSVAAFWHEVQSRLSGAPAATPKGFIPRSE